MMPPTFVSLCPHEFYKVRFTQNGYSHEGWVYGKYSDGTVYVSESREIGQAQMWVVSHHEITDRTKIFG